MMIAPMRLPPRLRPLVCLLILKVLLAMALLFLQRRLPANLFLLIINKILTSPKMMLLPPRFPLLINASLRPQHHRQRHRQRQYPATSSTSKFFLLIVLSFLIFDILFSNLLLLLLLFSLYFSDCLGDSSSDLSDSSYYHRIMVRQRSRRKPHPSSSSDPIRKQTAEETFRNIADGKSPTTGAGALNPRAGRRRQRNQATLPLHRESRKTNLHISDTDSEDEKPPLPTNPSTDDDILPYSLLPPSQPDTTSYPSDIGTAAAPADGTFSISNVLTLMKNDEHLFGARTDTIVELDLNDPAYEKFKLSIVKRFFTVLASRTSTCQLAELVADPDLPGVRTQRFYVAIRGVRTPQKQKLLGQCLLLFSSQYRKIKFKDADLSSPQVFADAQYQPNVIGTGFRTLFSHLHKNSIQYNLAKDFNGQGKYSLSFLIAVFLFILHTLSPYYYLLYSPSCRRDASLLEGCVCVHSQISSAIWYLSQCGDL